MSWEIERYHDFSAGHRVYGHEGKCAFLHGHNYRVHFTCAANGQLDSVGRVIDFSVVKQLLCNWIEDNWDHKFLIWSKDPMLDALFALDPRGVVPVPFNPTAENIAEYLTRRMGPLLLVDTDVTLVQVRVEETRKCSATYRLESYYK